MDMHIFSCVVTFVFFGLLSDYSKGSMHKNLTSGLKSYLSNKS